MKIRSVTCFVDVDETLGGQALAAAGDLARAAQTEVANAQLDLQTVRLAVQPLGQILRQRPPLDFVSAFETKFRELGFDYAALLFDDERFFDHVTESIRQTERLFASLSIASRGEGISLTGIRAAARVVFDLAQTTPGGFGNFRFAAAANCPPGVPFFPVAYANKKEGSFAFATEAADLAVEAFTKATGLDAARVAFVGALEEHGERLKRLGERFESAFNLRFAGIDFSLAPYPEQARSIGTALERVTGTQFGATGTLFGAAFLTDCLRRARFPRAGFSGLMLPVLEDWTLAVRSTENRYSLDSLLLYSSVCGTGLDTVPLAGDTGEAAIAALLLDLSALAIKLDKPLTARLFPVPGLRAGELTRFSFEYFANARTFDIGTREWLKVFDRTERIQLI